MSISLKNYWIRNLNFLESLDDAILISDPKGKLIDSNDSAKNLGLAPEKRSLKECQWYPLLSDKSPKEKVFLTIRTSQGKLRCIANCIPVILEEKEPAKAFHFRNITPQKMAEAKAKRFESLFRRKESKLKELEIRDKLTGLFNRDYTVESFRAEVFRAERTENKIGVVYFDIDRLKGINEAFGNSKGDLFIKAMGKILLENSRKSDIACRLGGEEFLLLLPGASRNIVLERAEKIRKLFSEYVVTGLSGNINATVSVGAAMYPEDGLTQDDLLREVQTALHIAKRSGRNRVIATATKE